MYGIDDSLLLEMATVRGNYVKTDKIDFSFYFSDKTECNYGIRVKVKWNPVRVSGSLDGYFELYGDYVYVQSNNSDSHPSAKSIIDAQNFFKKYKVLFAAVWEEKLDPNDLIDYFRGRLTWKQLLKCFMNVNDIEYNMIQLCNDRKELEKCVRVYEIFNMND